MSFEMTAAQTQAFSEGTAGTVSTVNATDLITLITSVLAIAWLLVVFMGYTKKSAHKEIELLDYLYAVVMAVFVVIIVASILFS